MLQIICFQVKINKCERKPKGDARIKTIQRHKQHWKQDRGQETNKTEDRRQTRQKTQHRKLKEEQHGPHYKTWGIETLKRSKRYENIFPFGIP
jgi:hypothetical protein